MEGIEDTEGIEVLGDCELNPLISPLFVKGDKGILH